MQVILPTAEDFGFKYAVLSSQSAPSIMLRFEILRMFNETLEKCIDLVDVVTNESSRRTYDEACLGPQQLGSVLTTMCVLFRIGSLVAALSYAVFGDVKTRVVSRAVDMTWASRGHHSTRVTIDNMRALLSREAGESDLATSQCVFAQVLHPLACLVMVMDCDVRVLTPAMSGINSCTAKLEAGLRRCIVGG